MNESGESGEKDVLGDFIARAELDAIPMDTFAELSSAKRQARDSLSTIRAVGNVGVSGSMHERFMIVFGEIDAITDELIVEAQQRKQFLVDNLSSTDPVERLKAERELNQGFVGWNVPEA